MTMIEDDLWTLKNVIRTGDRVVSTVFRRVDRPEDRVRAKETYRKPFTVRMKVEEVEFRKFSDTLRISGVIEEGGEDVKGDHQSINVGIEDEIEIIKEKWSRQELELLRESVNSESRDVVIFVALDDETAEVYEMKSYGLMPLASILSGKTGKRYESSYSETGYFEEIWGAVKTRSADRNILVILGGGFTRSHFEAFLKEKRGVPALFSFATGRSDQGAVYEFLESDRSEDLLKEARLRKEKTYLDMFMRALGKEEPVAYGTLEVEKASAAGAVSVLLVTETSFRGEKTAKIMDEVRNAGGEVHIISGHDESGAVVERFGGLCAILRYRL